jgi:hypothetical protein
MAAHSAYVIWYLHGKGEDGEPFLMSDGIGVGYGARPFADGNDAVYSSRRKTIRLNSSRASIRSGCGAMPSTRLCTLRIRRCRRLRNTRFLAARYRLPGPVFHRQDRVSFA